jgi:hypothetical protein
MAVPLGSPLQLTDEQLDRLAEVTPADMQRAEALWISVVKPREFRTLLDAVEVEIVQDDAG